MGGGEGEFVRLPLCEEGGTTPGCPDLGDLSRPAVQSASVFRYLAICDVVCTDGGGHGEYVQEIPLKKTRVGWSNLTDSGYVELIII